MPKPVYQSEQKRNKDFVNAIYKRRNSMKEFVVEIEEINGEQEYTFYKIIKAKTIASAENHGDEIAKKWYDGRAKRALESDYWEHFDGQISVKVGAVYEFNAEEFINNFRG